MEVPELLELLLCFFFFLAGLAGVPASGAGAVVAAGAVVPAAFWSAAKPVPASDITANMVPRAIRFLVVMHAPDWLGSREPCNFQRREASLRGRHLSQA